MRIQQLLNMAGANMLVHLTHIDDSVRGRQGPCVYFWGMTHDRSLYLLMEKYLESIRHYLEAISPPLNLNVLNQVCCVLINHQWHRAKVLELKLSHAGTIDVFCIDSGDTHTVPLGFVRTLDIPAKEAEHIRDWPPLATKFILADVVAPRGPGSRSHWSEPAVIFLKMHVENRTWKASPMGMYGEHQGVRLFDSNNQLLATTMIQQGLGVAAQTYHEALSMCEMMNKQPAYIQPAFNTFSGRLNVPTLNNTLPPAFAIPATYRDHHPAYPMAAACSPNQSPIPPRAYVTNDIPSKGRHDVIVTHIPDGPHKFYVQLKSEASDFLRLRKKLDSTAPPALRGVPKLGTPCVALSPTDKLCHRGLITAVGDYGDQCTVYFADIGTQEPVNLDSICEISDELLVPRLFAYRVSLFGVEEVAKLVGLNEIFTSLVNSVPYLKVEVVEDDEGKQKVNLYDNLGRSIWEMLCTILANFGTSRVCSPVAPIPSPPKLNQAATACVTEIPSAVLPEEPGYFFGQLEKIPVKDLNVMVAELTMAYSTDPNPPLLYADVKSHLGHYAVIHWDEDNNFYRIRVNKELINDAEVQFTDYGNSLLIPRCKILAPLEGLTCFRNPPYGIHCKIDGGVMQSIPNWRELMNEKQIKVKIGSLVDGVYSVTLTDDPCNNDIAKAISSGNLQKKPVVSVPEQSTCSDNAPVQVENVSEQTARGNNDRFRRNTDNGNSGRSHYVHPKAKDTNWRAAGTEDTTQTGQVRTSSKECNWRSSSNQVQEVIRAPRGPPPSTGNGETKGPMGFQRLGQVNKSQPPLLKPIIETSPPAVIPEEPKMSPTSTVQKQYTYMHQALPVANSQVQLTCVVDPTSFYVQLSANSTILNELVEKLNLVDCDELKPFIQNAKPGSACVVQYEEDSQWNRGQVLQLSDPPATIQLVTVKPISQLKRMVPRFMQCPQLTWHSRLKGVKKMTSGPVNLEPQKHIAACFLTGQSLSALFHSTSPDGNNGVFEAGFNVPGDVANYLIEQKVLDRVVLDTPQHLYVRLFEPSGLDLNEKLGLPESFKVESVAINLLEFNSLDDGEMSSPMSRTSEPALFDTFDDDVTLPLEVEVVRQVIEEPLVAIPTVIEHSENEEVELADRMEQVAVQEKEFYQSFGESVSSFVNEETLPQIMVLKEAKVMEQLAILDEEVKAAGDVTENLAQEIVDFVSAENATKDLNVSEPIEDLNVSAHIEDLNLPEKKSSGEDVSFNLIRQLTDAPSSTSPLESSLIDATQYIDEDPDVTLLSEAAAVTETTEVIEDIDEFHDLIELDDMEEFYDSQSADEALEDQPVVGIPCVARFTEDERYYRSKVLSVGDRLGKFVFLAGCSFQLPFAEARPVEPKLVDVDVDGLAADVSKAVLNSGLPWLEGTFGLVLIAVTKYMLWPLFKKYCWEKMVQICEKCCNKGQSEEKNSDHVAETLNETKETNIAMQQLLSQSTAALEALDEIKNSVASPNNPVTVSAGIPAPSPSDFPRDREVPCYGP